MNNTHHNYSPSGHWIVCLHCMNGYVQNGRCSNCGQPNQDPGRAPGVLPFGYVLQNSKYNRQYRIGPVLGQGGFGVTYLALDEMNRRRVAVKELFPGGNEKNGTWRDPNTQAVCVEPERTGFFQHVKKRFLDEARLLAELRNEPRIVNIYDYFEANNTGYYVMEFLNGKDLRKVFQQQEGVMSWQMLERPVRDVLQGLEVLHKRDLIHRDISPDNIFIRNDGTAMLIDFGSVRRTDAEQFTQYLKPDFAPPELFLSKGDQRAWSDTFSLCSTLYYLLSGGKKAASPDRLVSLKTTGKDTLVPLSDYSPNAPAYVIDAIMHGLNLEPEERFRNVQEMREALFPAPEPGRSQLVCVRGKFTGRRFPLKPDSPVPLGRGADNQRGIEYPKEPAKAPGISSHHCVFYLDKGGRLYVRDLQSRFGTYLNGKRLPPATWVRFQPGQRLRVGGEEYVFVSHNPNRREEF